MNEKVESILSALREQPLLRRIGAAAPGRGLDPVYLVGGILRDALLGRPFSPDIDLVSRDPIAVVRVLGQTFEGKVVSLDERCQRVIFPWGGHTVRVDISELRGSSIEEDLRLRDFTINAIATELGGQPSRLFDPLGGLRDLQERRIRMCHPHVFTEDPLRLLRAIRLASLLDFSLHEKTQESIRCQASLLSQAKAERIREEVFQILGHLPVSPWVRALDTLGLLDTLLPEIQEGKARALERVRCLEGIFSELEELFPEEAPALEARLAKEVEGGISRRALLSFVVLLLEFRQVAEERTAILRRIGSRLRLGRRAAAQVGILLRDAERPVRLWQTAAGAPLEADRFFRDLGDLAVDLLLLSLADRRAEEKGREESERYHRFIQQLMAFYRERIAPQRAAPILRGEDLIRHFRLPPGPFIGFLLERLHEQAVLGHLTSREEAFRYLDGHLNTLREEFTKGGKSP
jgi:tRNA nucleotidyltransferase/poly(A) polymerase